MDIRELNAKKLKKYREKLKKVKENFCEKRRNCYFLNVKFQNFTKIPR